MKTIVNNSDKILRSGEYGGLITEEEWNDTNKAKFSFCKATIYFLTPRGLKIYYIDSS